MKYEDVDDFIKKLFEQQLSTDDDMSGFDSQLANVEQEIESAYNKAMEWHSRQIAGGPVIDQADQKLPHFGASSGTDANDSATALEYKYWSEQVGAPTGLAANKPATVIINNRPTTLHVSNNVLYHAWWYEETQGVVKRASNVVIKIIASVVILVMLCMLVLTITDTRTERGGIGPQSTEQAAPAQQEQGGECPGPHYTWVAPGVIDTAEHCFIDQNGQAQEVSCAVMRCEY